MSPKILLVAAAALTASGAATLPASAAPEPGKMPLRATIMFNLVDRNHDGAIDKDELDAVRNAVFAAIDTNNDGKLTKDEIQAVGQGMRDRARGAMQGPRFGGQDGPRHGWQGGPPRDWGRGGPQFDQRHPGPGPRQGMFDGRGPQQPGMTGQAAAPDQGPLAGPQQDIASADQNGDGTISREEFAVGALPGVMALFGQ